MKRFWNAVIEPLLEAARPQTIVEVGCERGGNTRNLVRYCADHGCALHVIDPAPALDADELAAWQKQRDFPFALHQAPSLEVIPALDAIDVILLDGDHNWYTVLHELRAIEALTQNGNGPLPVIVLHDVGWPYGRRDMYYDPATIPERERQPIAQGGMHPDFNALTGNQGYNVGVSNATHEGGKRNGVLTAIEDFRKTSAIEWSFHVVPVFHGLGILCPVARSAWNEELAQVLDNLPEAILRHGLLDAVEKDRVLREIETADLNRVLASSLDCLESSAEEASLLPKLEATFEVLFRSWRWRIGNMLVSFARKLLRRGRGDDVREILDTILTPARQRLAVKAQHRSGGAHARLTRQFHDLYYDNEQRTWKQTFWLGTLVQKCPLDLWIYQEILHETRPDLIIETGTHAGGSALFMASICDRLGHGRVVTVDLRPQIDRPEHPRITYLAGNSVDPTVVEQLRELARTARRVMVVLDSDHSRDHVLAELQAYAPLVTEGCYLIVEDTNLVGPAPGAREALRDFLQDNTDFVTDPDREKFYLTFNPGGYLRRLTPRPANTPDNEHATERDYVNA